MSQRNPDLYIAPSDVHGRGVYCSKFIPEGEIIEICPVLVLPKKDLEQIRDTKLYNYYFIWGDQDEAIAIILGFGSLYNHSYLPNAEYYPLKDILPGDEILINYNGNPEDKTKVWFDE